MRQFVKNNSLSIVLVVLFAVMLLGQSLVGRAHYSDEQTQHGQEMISYIEYIGTGDFIESVFENWESEFLAIFAMVYLTIYLRQKGSPESKEVSAPNGQTGTG